MKIIKTIGVLLVITGLIFAMFAALDPRVKTPIFMDKNVKFVAYREAIMTDNNHVTHTYEQVVLLVTKVAELPDTKVTISGTAFPITNGVIYYFSAYYYYMPTYYTTAGYMSIGPLTYTNVYTELYPKYYHIQTVLTKSGVVLIIFGVLLIIGGSINLEKSEEKKEKEEVIVKEEVVGEEDEEDEEEPFADYEEVDDDDLFVPPE